MRPDGPHPALSATLLPQAGEGTVIDCRGFAARDALPELRGVRGEMLLVRTREISLRRPVRLLHPRIPLYIAPRADGVFMIGATMIESADQGGVSVRSAIELLSAAYALHPGVRRGGNPRDERRRPPGLSRQRAAHH